MQLHLHRPGPPLDRFVELVTYYSDYQPQHSKERLLPDGAVEIIVDLTDSPKHLYDRHDFSRGTAFRRAWISGMRRDWIVIEAAPGSSMVVIRFKPAGAYPFLGFGVEDLTDTVDELDRVLDSAASSLRDRVLEAPTIAEKMVAVEEWLRERSRSRLEGQPVVEYLTGRLFAPAGIRIQDVVEEVGYSQRHVRGLFRRWVGVTPKQYGRIRRFQEVLGAVARSFGSFDAAATYYSTPEGEANVDWADLAVAHGYYDQSHLVHDFRRFSGLTPTEYVTAFRGQANYLPID
ncbi:MAG: AraC family transcriptional regulator [Thermoanaerobaculia bacterium]|nr:AraC family transcriptional regulator [Thermoanaerobaculia bacterium]